MVLKGVSVLLLKTDVCGFLMSQRDSRLNYTCSARMYVCTNMCFRSVQRNFFKKKKG